MNTAPEPLRALLRRYVGENDEPRDVPRVSFAEAVKHGDDPFTSCVTCRASGSRSKRWKTCC
jgi:hypothetical protein